MSNFHPLEVGGRGSEIHLQMSENSSCITCPLTVNFNKSHIDYNYRKHKFSQNKQKSIIVAPVQLSDCYIHDNLHLTL